MDPLASVAAPVQSGPGVTPWRLCASGASVSDCLIYASEEVDAIAGKIECRERLGGMLRYYYRKAA